MSTTKSHPCSLISKPGPLLQPATLGQSKSCCSRIPGNADGQCLQSCQTFLGHHRELHQEGKVSNHRATFVWLTVDRFKHLSLDSELTIPIQSSFTLIMSFHGSSNTASIKNQCPDNKCKHVQSLVGGTSLPHPNAAKILNYRLKLFAALARI